MVVITEQDDILKEMKKHIYDGFDQELEKKMESFLPLVVLEDGMVQIDPRFTTHC